MVYYFHLNFKHPETEEKITPIVGHLIKNDPNLTGNLSYPKHRQPIIWCLYGSYFFHEIDLGFLTFKKIFTF